MKIIFYFTLNQFEIIIMFKIRIGNSSDLESIKSIFEDSVSNICSKNYAGNLINKWLEGLVNSDRWNKIINEQTIFIAYNEKEDIGFATVDRHYIDMFFVHSEYQRKGVANALYNEVEKLAISKNKVILEAEVSISAKAFFEKMGFIATSKQDNIYLDGSVLINYKMYKTIG